MGDMANKIVKMFDFWVFFCDLQIFGLVTKKAEYTAEISKIASFFLFGVVKK